MDLSTSILFFTAFALGSLWGMALLLAVQERQDRQDRQAAKLRPRVDDVPMADVVEWGGDPADGWKLGFRPDGSRVDEDGRFFRKD
jgi:hypothetical protein